MTMLDCHDPLAARGSIAAILGLTSQELDTVIASLSVDDISDHPWTEDLFADVVLRARYVRHSGTYYFHMTRTQNPQALYHGIEPLGQVLDRLWDSLGSLAAPDIGHYEWADFRGWLATPGNGDHSGELYRMKKDDPIHWGPFGALVRESAFQNDELGQHDYLAVPEIIEDICTVVASRFRLNLLERFVAASSPCIVKFATGDTQPQTLETAIAYLWEVGRQRTTYAASYSHDAAGPIPGDRVIAVEIVK